MSGALVRDDLVYAEDHADAMIAATSASERAAVLASVERRHLGGIRVTCTRHGGSYSFAELRGHLLVERYRGTHEPGDVVPADDDPRELGRGGQTAADR